MEERFTPWQERALAALPWLAWLAAVLPVLILGFPAGHDWALELTRIAEYHHALASGQWPPFWAENIYAGYGSPVFLFYAPLHAAVATAASLVAGSYAGGASAAIVLFAALAVWTSGRLARSLLRQWPAALAVPAARVAASLYVLNPYLICDALLRNANAEYAALCLLPLPLDGVLRLAAASDAASRRCALAQVALGLTLLILAHNLTALIAMALVLALGAAAMPWRRLSELFAAIVLGLVGASFFWLPALRLRGLVRLEDLAAGKFDFHQQFQSLARSFGWDAYFAVGLLPPLLLVVALAVSLILQSDWRNASGRILVVLWMTALGAFFFQLPISTPLWDVLPFLPLFQFPWRFMGPLALAVALLTALVFARLLAGRSLAWRRLAEVGLVVLALANAVPHLRDTRPLLDAVRGPFEASLEAEVIRRSRDHQVTVLDEYLPRAVSRRLSIHKPAFAGPVIGVRGSASYEVVGDQSRRIELSVVADGPAVLSLARWHFPGWQARVDGAPVSVRANPAGSLDVAVPAGAHRVVLTQQDPWERRFLLLPSLAALLATLLLSFRNWPQP